MAEAEVSIVIGRLGDLLISEAKFLFGVRDTVERTRDELQLIRCFLEDAGARMRDGDEQVHLKIVAVREAAYVLEDVIETYVLRVYSRRKRGLKNVLKRPAWILNHVFEIRKFRSESERISNRISALASDLKRYGIQEVSISSSTQRHRELRRSYSHIVEYDVVGLDKDIKELVSCFEAISHGVWIRSFISGLRIVDSISRPLRIFCDNSAAVFMAKNNKSGSRSKYIDIKYLAIRERV